jgi:hypothetical protein
VAPSSGLPTDIRRSDCRSESHQPQELRARCKRNTSRRLYDRQYPVASHSSQIACFFTRAQNTGLDSSQFCARTVEREKNARKNAPSRWPLCPASRLTFAEAPADRRAFVLRNSVLGAIGTLGETGGRVKSRRCPIDTSARNLRLFLHTSTNLLMCEGALERNGTSNSPSRVRFRPQPRVTFRFRVVPPGGASSYSRPVLGAVGTLC